MVVALNHKVLKSVSYKFVNSLKINSINYTYSHDTITLLIIMKFRNQKIRTVEYQNENAVTLAGSSEVYIYH